MFLSIRPWNGQKITREGTRAGDRFNGILTLTGAQFGQLFGPHGGSLIFNRSQYDQTCMHLLNRMTSQFRSS